MSSIASQTTYRLKLQNRCDVAERTMAFQFEKPAGFVFKAGQFIDMTLINPSQTDAEGNGRAFPLRVPLMKVGFWLRLECGIQPSSGSSQACRSVHT